MRVMRDKGCLQKYFFSLITEALLNSLILLIGGFTLMKKCLYLFLFSFLLVSCTKNDDQKQSGFKNQSYHTSEGGSLTWKAPTGWGEEVPASSMRKAQYRLPKVAEDTEDAMVAIFYFPGQGGSVQDNLDRWYGQFIQPDGKSTKEVAKVSKETVNNLPQTTVDVSGTYADQMRPMGPSTPKAGFRLLGGIIETGSGPWFVKLTGPEKSVEHWKDSFNEFMKSFKG